MTALFEEMLEARAAPAGTRRAALMLHALPASDRQWVLAHLSEPQRLVLDTLLSELRELGIPPDAAVDLSRPESPVAPVGSRSWTQPVRGDASRAAALRSALVNEPPLLVDAALALQDEAVRREVSVALSRPVRDGATVPVRMARSLRQRLEGRLATHAGQVAPPLVTGAWRERITRVLRRLRGGDARRAGACLDLSGISTESKERASQQ